MASPTIEFRTIRPHQGSQHNGFEELVCQLAALDVTGVPFHRKGAGADAGVECYRVDRDGFETGWQAKYFFELGSSEASQLKDSFDNAVAKHPLLARLIVCLPFDLSDGRVAGRKSERDRWNDWVTARKASVLPRIVEIELWGAFQLTERLSRSDPLHVGRRTYWFDLPHFGLDWLRERFVISRAALGRRYTPELNVQLPIRKSLAAFARDPETIRAIWQCADDLDEARHRWLQNMGSALGASHSADVSLLDDQVAGISAAIRAAPLTPINQLPLAKWRASLKAALATLDRCRMALWDFRLEKPGNSERARSGSSYAERLNEVLNIILEAIGSPDFDFVNERRLLLCGEAGVGKSHLVADVAEFHITHGLPAILLVGSQFSDADPWCQIAQQLGLSTTPPDVILGALDAAAEAAGARALVIVDAINERNGIVVWSERLAAFLTVADRFKHVAILVSCRTTFIPYIVRDIGADFLPRLEHPGFAGRAAEAARRYLDQRGIVRMAAPNLAPEFENPLFLRTCCDMLERRGECEMPRGLTGVSAIFNFYFSAVAESINQRMGLVPKLRLVEQALAKLTEAMVIAGTGYLTFEDSNAVLDGVHPSNGSAAQNLLVQLEHEGVLAVEPVKDGDAVVEWVRFTFERLSDHRIAQRLLDRHVSGGNPKSAFAIHGPLALYVSGQDSYRYAGIAEALSVQLPERFGVELIDAVEDKSARWGLVHGFQLSLLWRRQASFSDRTMKLIEECIGTDGVFETLLEIATEPENRFNADHLDGWLKRLLMPERDVHWSIPATRVMSRGEGPIKTLIDWVMSNGLGSIESDRARLAAITLAWLTSLSHRWVRDMATKALANLLVNRRALAAALIAHFADVDDAYVVDRVLAAAYGAATRNSSNEGLAELASIAFAAVFARVPLQTHALIRDHARGIIELAAARGVLPDGFPLDCVRPPYPPGLPLEVISDEVIGSYVQKYGERFHADDICRSAMERGDFARYVIEPLAQKFLQLPRAEYGRSMREIYDNWHKTAIEPHPHCVKALGRVIEVAKRIRGIPFDFQQWQVLRAAEKELKEAIVDLESLFNDVQIREFRMRAAGYLQGRMWNSEASLFHPDHSGESSCRWVVWRAHELGWTAERFAQFDGQIADQGRMEHRIERIGKKYQWIAFHELTGRLSDIALLNTGFRDDPDIYKGPWQVNTREMDPSNLVTRTMERRSVCKRATWWSPHFSHWRHDTPQARIAWMEDRSRDIPDPVQLLDVQDGELRNWLVLDTTISQNQRVLIGGERQFHRMTWRKVRSMIVARQDVEKLEELLRVSERDRDNPPKRESRADDYLGEYYWHPAFEDWSEDQEVGDHDKVAVKVCAISWYIERSGYDYSVEESINLAVPSPVLVRGLGLRLADGSALSYITTDGSVIFKDPSTQEPGASAAIVDRAAMRDFLRNEELELVWIFTGEKSAHGGPEQGRAWGGMLEYWGIYRFNDGAICGTLNFEQKNPSPEQLEEFLASG